MRTAYGAHGALVFSTTKGTTMNIRNLGLAAITAAALVPSISSASPERDSLKACARAFAASIAAPGAAPLPYKIDYRGTSSSFLAQYYAYEYTFDLQAHDPKTGAAVARATCTTNYKGDVIALSAVPLEARTATLAARY